MDGLAHGDDGAEALDVPVADATAVAAATPLPQDDPWQGGQDPWSEGPNPGKGLGHGKGTEMGSVSQSGKPGHGKPGKGKKGKGKGEKGAVIVEEQSQPEVAPPLIVTPESTVGATSPSLQPAVQMTQPMPSMSSMEPGAVPPTPWGQPTIYGPQFGCMPHATPPGMVSNGYGPVHTMSPHVTTTTQQSGMFIPPSLGPHPGACMQAGPTPQPWMMPSFPMTWPCHGMSPMNPMSQHMNNMQPTEGSMGSWSKPSVEQSAKPPKPSKKKESQEADGPGDPSEPEEPDDASQRSSTAATSEIKSMLKRRLRQEDGYRPKSSLGSVKVEEFYGDRTRYLKWKRTIQAQQHLYALEGNELAMLVYLSTRREARDVVEQNPIQSYTEQGELQLLWKVLDEAFGESDAELFERVDKELDRCRRQPGETVAHYLSEMKRLRAQYSRVDPESKISDMAWGQRLLQRASLSRRERHDVYYAAGACFQSSAIEKALRVRCGRIHEDEKKGNYKFQDERTPPYRPKGQQYFKKKVIVKKQHGAHVAMEEEGEQDDGLEEERMEEDEEAMDILYEDEEQAAEDEEGEDEENDSLDAEDLKEVFAAGWRAKQKTAEVRKNRVWKTSSGGNEKGAGKGGRSVDLKKKSSTCSSCGKVGHWKGDSCCPSVLNGRDQPHVPSSKKPAQTVHFTFMTNNDEEIPPPGHCPNCRWPVPLSQRFCRQCGHPQLMDADMSQHKRLKEEVKTEEDEKWDMVDPPPVTPPFTFEVPRQTALAAAALPQGQSLKGYGSVKLQTKEVMAALPSMSKEEKKKLQKALKEDEEEAAYAELKRIQASKKTIAEYTDFGPDHIWNWERDPRPRWQEQGSRASASTQGPIAPAAPPKKDDSLPKPLRDQELRTFRQNLYDRQVQGGRLVPSKAAPTPTEKQAQCLHPFNELRWSANQDGHYAKCKLCDLKSVIYWSSKHGALMVAMAHDRPEGVPWQAKVWVREEDKEVRHLQEVNEGGPLPQHVCCRVTKDKNGQVLQKDDFTGDKIKIHEPLSQGPMKIVTEFWYIEPHQVEVYNAVKKKLPPHLQTPGLAIADSGCRNAVGGRLWHEAFQDGLKKLQVPWMEVKEYEVYRFGAGAPAVSQKAFLYPVLVHGQWDVVRISMVEGEALSCPGLIGPSELSRWEAVFRFCEKELELNGESRPMILTWTRHPGIQLLDYGSL